MREAKQISNGVNTDPKKVESILTRGVAEVISRKHLEKRLRAGEKLRVKFGIDPTAPVLHLGHSVPLRKLREFQGLGHQIVFLIGNFTAMIGDPSARVALRKPLTEKEIKKNMRDYIQQAAKILNMKKVEVRYNSEWYKKKGATFLMDITSRFTYARLIERDEFKKRIERGIDISMLELIYPLLQGYDSVELKADLEIGGTDQKFNLLMGRKVQKKYNQPQQDILSVPLLEGTDGVRKMSKSYNNYIALTEAPLKMYGNIMSVPDTIIWHYFTLLTNLSLEEIEKMKKEVCQIIFSLRDAKARLAKEIVAIYHGKKAATQAEQEFNKIFRKKKLPTKIPEIKIKEKSLNILELLVKTKLAPSKSEAKRLILQRGVKINGKIESDWKKVLEIKKGQVVQVGKRKFIRLAS